MKRLLLLCVLAAVPAPASAEGLRLQIESLASITRIFVTCASGKLVRTRHEGDRLIISTDPPIGRAIVSGRAPLVLASTTALGKASLDITAGASMRQSRLGSKTVIDIFPPVRPERDPADVNQAPNRPAAGAKTLIPGLPTAFAARIDDKDATAQTEGISQAEPTRTTPSPRSTNSIAAKANCSAPGGKSILLPFSPEVGIAGFRREGSLTLFFDEARPVDLAAFDADPVFGGAAVKMLDNATEIRLPIKVDQHARLERQSGGWCLTIDRTPSDRIPIRIETSGSGLRFVLHSPGKVLTALDPSSGATLLIGTDRAGDSANFMTRRSELFAVERSMVGVIVEPFSDRAALHPTRDGFALVADNSSDLAIPRDSVDDEAARTGLTRILDTQSAGTEELARRLREQLATAARTPERARLSPRLSAAQSMLELGMGREAHTLLRVAFTDDPSASVDGRAQFLQALADTAVDPSSASFGNPHLPATDETRLWRALTDTAPPLHTDAAIVASALPLLLSYPEHLRDIAAGLAAPLLLADGRPTALAALRALPSTASTDVTKANGLIAGGQTAGALTQLDLLAQDRDLGISSNALLSATLLRARLGQLSPKQAMLTLEQHRLDWRATGQEGPVMLQEALLARKGGEIVAAIQLWREIERRFPNLREPAQSAALDTLVSLTAPETATALSPADFVTIVTGSAPELTSHPEIAAKLGPALADRLEALDLPVRATEILRKLMDATPPGTEAATLGAKLAAMLLEQDDAAGAKAVLDRSGQPGLPPALDEQRRLTLARLLERQGHHDAALAALHDLSGGFAQDQRATILAAAGRWHDAKLALIPMTNSIPGDGTLKSDQADLMIRLATAASRDTDKPLLERLARQSQGRWADREQQRVFDLITAPILSDAKAPMGSRAASQSLQQPNAG
jgi:hypothetical protein